MEILGGAVPFGLVSGAEGTGVTYTIGKSLRLKTAASGVGLTRTFGTPTSTTNFTFSTWVKYTRSTAASAASRYIISAPVAPAGGLRFTAAHNIAVDSNGATPITSPGVYNDTAAWYHVVVKSTASSTTLYVNGVQQGTTAAAWVGFNVSGKVVWFGVPATYASQPSCDGFFADVYLIDGQSLDPTSFGEYNSVTGIWQPKAYSGTYGNNGFFLNFSDASSTTTIGYDSSGNGNHWTTSGISVTAGINNDSMLDTPTNNHCIWNVYDYDAGTGTPQAATLPTNGNLNLAYSATTWSGYRSTMAATTGKWYVEMTCTAGGGGYNTSLDVIPTSQARNLSAGGVTIAPTAGSDVLAFALNLDNNTWTTYRNNVQVSTGSTTAGVEYCFRVTAGNGVNTFTNFGQRAFTYTPPTGYKAFNTNNLPIPSIKRPNRQMDVSTYTGTSATNSVTNSGGFQPDLVWIKNRSSALHHYLNDSVRGTYKILYSSLTDPELNGTATSDGVSSFNSNGFTVLNGTNVANYNASANTYVAWQWKRSVTAGFDIVTYTGTGANRTVSHGLGVAPSLIIVKQRTAASSTNWGVYHKSLGSTNYAYLNTTSAAAASAVAWNNTDPTSSVFTVGTGNPFNASGGTFVAYCWAEIPGFSKFGSYTGNGSTDGPFVYCGFRPRWIMIKDTTSAVTNWILHDTARDTYNQSNNPLFPNATTIETAYSSSQGIDVLSNGFKVKVGGSPINISTDTHIFAAFAEVPFKYGLGR